MVCFTFTFVFFMSSVSRLLNPACLQSVHCGFCQHEMMIETFVSMARYLSSRHDDDWSDRLHYSITPNILLAFSVLISFKQFGGRPIECMFPNKFPGSWEQVRVQAMF
uniref:Innexin n=1 Tax=Angiostrongylus cantonensis TaxID=6313 RepID=A0A0K0CYT4_ANGCA